MTVFDKIKTMKEEELAGIIHCPPEKYQFCNIEGMRREYPRHCLECCTRFLALDASEIDQPVWEQ